MNSNSPRPDNLIPYPRFDEIKAQVEKLRTELSMLVVERDELVYVECRNIEAAYMLAIGGLEYKAHEVQCAVLRLKRKIQMLQARKNRQEAIFLPEIEEALDTEFAEYKAKLDEQIEKMNAALEHSRCDVLTDEETREIKKAYRSIVKALHPDLNPEQDESRLRLFYHAVAAYENGDLEAIRIIAAMIAETSVPDETEDALALLFREKDRLLSLVKGLKDKIAKIKTEYPYTMKTILQSADATAARKAELQAKIDELNATLPIYREKIDRMLRRT